MCFVYTSYASVLLNLKNNSRAHMMQKYLHTYIYFTGTVKRWSLLSASQRAYAIILILISESFVFFWFNWNSIDRLLIFHASLIFEALRTLDFHFCHTWIHCDMRIRLSSSSLAHCRCCESDGGECAENENCHEIKYSLKKWTHEITIAIDVVSRARKPFKFNKIWIFIGHAQKTFIMQLFDMLLHTHTHLV